MSDRCEHGRTAAEHDECFAGDDRLAEIRARLEAALAAKTAGVVASIDIPEGAGEHALDAFQFVQRSTDYVSELLAEVNRLRALPQDPPAPESVWEVFTAGDGERAIRMKESAPVAVSPTPEPADFQSAPPIESEPADGLKSEPEHLCVICGEMRPGGLMIREGHFCPTVAAADPEPDPDILPWLRQQQASWDDTFGSGGGDDWRRAADEVARLSEPMTTLTAEGQRMRLEPLLCTECDGTGATGAFECDHCLGNGMKNHPPLFRLVPIGGE